MGERLCTSPPIADTRHFLTSFYRKFTEGREERKRRRERERTLHQLSAYYNLLFFISFSFSSSLFTLLSSHSLSFSLLSHTIHLSLSLSLLFSPPLPLSFFLLSLPLLLSLSLAQICDDLALTDSFGMNCLHLACGRGHVSIANVVVKYVMGLYLDE